MSGQGLQPNQQNSQMIRQKVEVSSFCGPLPPPEILQKYDEILPGAADRIMKMAENQSAHRRLLEAQVIQSDIKNSKIGLLFGFIIGVLGIIGSVTMVLYGKEVVGTILGGGTLVSLVTVFVYGSESRRKERTGRKIVDEKK